MLRQILGKTVRDATSPVSLDGSFGLAGGYDPLDSQAAGGDLAKVTPVAMMPGPENGPIGHRMHC